jgi:hypothetical protein
MTTFWMLRCYWSIAVAMGTILSLGLANSIGSAEARSPAKPAEIDSADVTYKLPSQLDWTGNPGVSQAAVLFGDPSKPGLYMDEATVIEIAGEGPATTTPAEAK